MRFILICLSGVFLLASNGCIASGIGGHSRSGLRVWKAYTFEGDYQLNQRNASQAGGRFTVEQWEVVDLDSGTYCLRLELSQPDDRWSPDTAGPHHNDTSPIANLFILSEQRPPFDVTLNDAEEAAVSVWMMETGYVYDLTDEHKLRERLQDRATRYTGDIEVRRGWNRRLYIHFDIISDRAGHGRSTVIKGELLTHRHVGIVTWRSNAKGIRSRFNNSWFHTTWP